MMEPNRELCQVYISGCDDVTTFGMMLSERERVLVAALCELSRKHSQCNCQPKMRLFLNDKEIV